MYKLVLLNKNNEKFEKVFNSEYLMNKFINKVKRGKKLKIVSCIREV